MAEQAANSQDSPPTYSEAAEDCYVNTIERIGDNATNTIVSDVGKSLREASEALKQFRQELAKVDKKCDPSISMLLRDLETFVAAVLRESRSFVKACRDLAKYASSENVLENVLTDLRNGHFDEVEDFLDEFAEYLDYCETCFNKVYEANNVASKLIHQTGGYKRKETGTKAGESDDDEADPYVFKSPGFIQILSDTYKKLIRSISEKLELTSINVGECLKLLDKDLKGVMHSMKHMRKEIETAREHPEGYDGLMKKKEKAANKCKEISKVREKTGRLKEKKRDAAKKLEKPLMILKERMSKMLMECNALLEKLQLEQ